MEMDPVLGCLAILFGASVMNVMDEALQITPKLSGWLTRFMGLE